MQHWGAAAAEVEALRSELSDIRTRLAEIEGSAIWGLGQRWNAFRRDVLDGLPLVTTTLVRLRKRFVERHHVGVRPRGGGPSVVSPPPPPAWEPLAVPPVVTTPLVSVIVPGPTSSEGLAATLQSLVASTWPGTYEVLVLISPDATEIHRLLAEHVRGVRVCQTGRNFARNCNDGARLARGGTLVFVAPGVTVHDGWLDPIMHVLDRRHAGMVLPRLLRADGRLCSAGRLLTADGRYQECGWMEHPEAPAFNYVRAVDAGAPAFFVVCRPVFEAIGGLDEHMGDKVDCVHDLAMAIWAAGRQVLLQPAALAVDPSGGAGGGRLGDAFRDKWGDALTRGAPAARAQSPAARVIFIDRRVPTWDQDSGSRRMMEYIRILVTLGCDVALWPDDGVRREPYSKVLQQWGVQVLHGLPDFGAYWARHADSFDVAYVSRCHIAEKYIHHIKGTPGTRIVYDPHDLSFVRERREAQLLGSKALLRRAAVSERMELRAMAASDAVVSVSTVEQDLVKQLCPGPVNVLLQSVYEQVASVHPWESRSGLLFLGGFDHAPNVDAALWFVGEVLPRIHARLPEATLYIVGSNPPNEVRHLASDRVRVLGYVEDLGPCFALVRVSVVPLRYGAGEKGKVAHSLSRGVPVVSTPIGAEGMMVIDGEHVLLGETAHAFADAVVDLYTDAKLWARMARAGLSYAEAWHSRSVMATRLKKLLTDLGVAPPGGLDPAAAVGGEHGDPSDGFGRWPRHPFGRTDSSHPETPGPGGGPTVPGIFARVPGPERHP